MSIRTKIVPALLACTVLVTGCAGPGTQSLLQARDVEGVSSDLVKVAARPMRPANQSRVRKTGAAYVGAKTAYRENGDPLPVEWRSKKFALSIAGPADFGTIAHKITSITNIPVAIETLGQGGSSEASVAPTEPLGLAAGPVPQGFDVNGALQDVASYGAPAVSASQVRASAGFPGTMRVFHDGKLEDFLHQVASNFNVSWSYDKKRILFTPYATRTYEIAALPVASKLKFDLNSVDGGGNAVESGSQQSASTESNFNLFEDLNNVLTNLLGQDGTYSVVPQTGQITVTARPLAQQRVRDYLSKVNEFLGRQVAVSVQVYSLVVSDSETFDLNYNLEAMLGDAVVAVAANGFSAGGVAAASAGGVGFSIVDEDVEADGLVEALSRSGRVSVITNSAVTTLNGTPVPVQVVNKRSYVSGISVASGEDVSQQGVETDSITTGFNLQLVPKIDNAGNVMLQYGINISELAGPNGGFDTFQGVQLPNVNERSFIQQVSIPNGKTLVLSGFEQSRAARQDAGRGSPRFKLLGGSTQASQEREIVVIAITPTVLQAAPLQAGRR